MKHSLPLQALARYVKEDAVAMQTKPKCTKKKKKKRKRERRGGPAAFNTH